MPSHLFSMLARVGLEMACVEAARHRTEVAGRATAARRTFAVVDVVRSMFEFLGRVEGRRVQLIELSRYLGSRRRKVGRSPWRVEGGGIAVVGVVV